MAIVVKAYIVTIVAIVTTGCIALSMVDKLAGQQAIQPIVGETPGEMLTALVERDFDALVASFPEELEDLCGSKFALCRTENYRF